jgi:hypothetical protein
MTTPSFIESLRSVADVARVSEFSEARKRWETALVTEMKEAMSWAARNPSRKYTSVFKAMSFDIVFHIEGNVFDFKFESYEEVDVAIKHLKAEGFLISDEVRPDQRITLSGDKVVTFKANM